VIAVTTTAISQPAMNTLIARSDGPPHVSGAVIIVALAVLLVVALFVIRFIWTLLRTISEMSANPAPGTTLFGTLGVLTLFGVIIYLIFFAQGSGQV
jgi:hypothetical protein